jgi:hypothetical protein
MGNLSNQTELILRLSNGFRHRSCWSHDDCGFPDPYPFNQNFKVTAKHEKKDGC